MTKRLLSISPMHAFIAMLLLLSGMVPSPALAQESAPAPNHAQVIAQGVQRLSDDNMQWRISVEQVGAFPDGAPYVLDGGFAFAFEEQLIVTDINGNITLLSPGQAVYVAPDAPKTILSATTDPGGIFVANLVTATGSQDKRLSDPFEVVPGLFNIQMTAGRLNIGEIETFQPMMDIPYLLIIPEGEVTVTDWTDGAISHLSEGDIFVWHDSVTIEAVGEHPAWFITIAIGDRVPEVTEASPIPALEPDTSADTGEIAVTFYDCDQFGFAGPDLDQCDLVPYPVYLLLNNYDDIGHQLHNGVDAAEMPNHSWLFTDVPVGEWEFALAIGDATTPPPLRLIGDVGGRGGNWYIQVEADRRSDVVVLLGPEESEFVTSSVSVMFLVCPTDWAPGDGFDTCGAAISPPEIILQDIFDADNSWSTWWDAYPVFSELADLVEFPGISLSTYGIVMRYDGYWTEENTWFANDAYQRGDDWLVDVYSDDYPPTIIVVGVGVP